MSKKKGTLHLVDPDAPVEESDDREYFELTDIREMVERGFRTPDGEIFVHETFRGRVAFPRVWFAPAPPAANLVACSCDRLEGMGPHFRYVGPALAEEE